MKKVKKVWLERGKSKKVSALNYPFGDPRGTPRVDRWQGKAGACFPFPPFKLIGWFGIRCTFYWPGARSIGPAHVRRPICARARVHVPLARFTFHWPGARTRAHTHARALHFHSKKPASVKTMNFHWFLSQISWKFWDFQIFFILFFSQLFKKKIFFAQIFFILKIWSSRVI